MLVSLTMLMMAAAADPVVEAPVTDPQQRVRCIREEMTGSRTRAQKVCRTVAEWNAIARDEQDNVKRQLSRVKREGS